MSGAVASRNWAPAIESSKSLSGIDLDLDGLRSPQIEFPPERLGLRTVLGPALGLVGPGAAGEAAMGGVVAGDVSHSVAAGGRALDELFPVFAPAVDAPEGHGAPQMLRKR